ncbi:MAG: hypothetical protein KatS3mg027_0447 [Bacteroidia bacterium]|nr:MAG: hypothetical protein KatS3mg027_0447 [Bacteroidia bacterium]
MKRVFLLFSTVFFVLEHISTAQITITNTVTLPQLLNGFIGSGLTVNNPSLNCPSGYAATFTTSGTCNLGITNGVLLATGAATVAQGPNTSGSASGWSSGYIYNDPQLTSIEPQAINDVCILEFDIVPSCSTLFIKYVFGSEEYPEFVGQFNDAFGFFITGPNGSCSGAPYNNTNVAVLPNGSPVSINNVNGSTNSSYYVNNTGGTCIQFDGMTVPITSTVNVCPCSTYHFKIAIADAIDHALDSGVFIDMFACNNPMTAVASTTASSCTSGCTGAASVTASGGSGSYTYTWLPTGGNSNVATGLCPGTYTVIVADASGGSCNQTTTLTVNVTGPSVPSFSISLSDDTLTCSQPTVSATAVNTNTDISTMNYTFTSISSGTSTSNPLTVSTPGTYTVFGMDPATGCMTTNTFAVGIYTTVPSVTVSPTAMTISCSGSASTFTGTSNPTVNISYSWIQPGGVPISGNLLTPGNAGTYTFVATNIANGCSATQTVSVSQSTNAPTMTVVAVNNNYNIKCSPNTVTLVVNATQAPGGGAPIPYWTDASGTNTLSTSNTFTVNTPGNYVCVVYDPSNGCAISQTLTVGMDTLKPTGGYTLNVPTNTLNCYYPSAIITGTSPVSGATYVWYTPGTVPQQTLSVNSTTNISQTTIGTYTVEITDPNNGCKRKIPVTIYQDKQPLGLTAKATPTALTCKDLQTTLQFTPNPITEPLTFTWTTPPPTSTNAINNPVTFYSSGTYTLCVTRTSNGCQTCTTVLVGSNTTPPATTPIPTATIACGYTNTVIYAGTTPSTNITYLWSGPRDATLTSINSYSTSVTTPGTYYVVITNTTTGCASQNSVAVVNGTIDANFTPNPSSGFAPLSVNFQNQSFIGNPANVVYYWSFGNGGTYTATPTSTSNPLPGANTTYLNPGTYTVSLIVVNGNCKDTVTKIITVDIPSNLEIPNVFTPNGDGVNDYFILHTTNLIEIECTIFDRWGAKMYEVKTDKGNIQWDGKTMGGKDAPTGTYYYIIKAKGLDEKEYEQKGFITLLR